MKAKTMTKQYDPKPVYDRLDRMTAGIEAVTLTTAPESCGDDPYAVGRIVIRGRASSSGRTVRAFVQVWGFPIVEGVALGGGYDMATAAVEAACTKFDQLLLDTDRMPVSDDEDSHALKYAHTVIRTIRGSKDGSSWENRLADAGIIVFRAI